MSLPKSLDAQAESKYTNPYAVDVIRTKRRDLVYGISHTEDLLNLLVTHGVITAVKRSILIATNGDMALLEKFLNDTDINTVNSSKNTLLHVAAEHGNVSAAELLICKGAKVDLQNNTGCTALHRAASRGHTDIVKALIQAGAPIHVVDDQGRTPVHLAAEQLQLESVSVLVKEEASQPESLRKNTFLHMAGREDNWKLMELLLQNGAPVDAMNNQMNTALFYAVQESNSKAVEVLLNAGAKTVKGFTPLHVAAHYDRAEIVALLVKGGAQVTVTLSVCEMIQCVTLLRDVLCLEVKDRQGRTALHLAAHSGGKSVNRFL
uniref:CARD- and ANK-containing Inflammasome Adaptor Protein n=1 Tax=Gouania willdenowi TaxID=441366 RepID=A0A8C5FYP1_GOUWI